MFSSHVSHIVHFCYKLKIILCLISLSHAFYCCMLRTLALECRNQGCGCLCSQNPQCLLCAFEHYLHLKRSEVSIRIRSSSASIPPKARILTRITVKWSTIREFVKKKAIHFALLDSFDFFQKPYICKYNVDLIK